MKSKLFIKKAFKKIDIIKNLNIAIAVILVILFTLSNSNFISFLNIKNILISMSIVMVIGAGVSFTLLIGSIDLSIGAVASFSGVIFALLVKTFGDWSIFAALLFGAVAGMINGLIYVYSKIPSFIVTLGTMGIWSSLALLLALGPVTILSKNCALLSIVKFGWQFINVQVIIAFLVVFGCYLILNKTKTGKYIYAIGCNEKAAIMAGISVNRTKIIAFSISGLLSALTGVFMALELRSASPYAGDSLLLLSIASVSLGGISLSGGRGSILRMVWGIAVVTLITNGITILGVNSYYQKLVYGFILLAAMMITSYKGVQKAIVK